MPEQAKTRCEQQEPLSRTRFMYGNGERREISGDEESWKDGMRRKKRQMQDALISCNGDAERNGSTESKINVLNMKIKLN